MAVRTANSDLLARSLLERQARGGHGSHVVISNALLPLGILAESEIPAELRLAEIKAPADLRLRHAQPHNVKFWSIGNENYGSWEAGAETVEHGGHFVREPAKLMRMVDPSIKLFAAATAERDWTIPLLRRAGDSPDVYNDVDSPERVVPEIRRWNVSNGRISLPPHSVTVARLPL